MYDMKLEVICIGEAQELEERVGVGHDPDTLYTCMKFSINK